MEQTGNTNDLLYKILGWAFVLGSLLVGSLLIVAGYLGK